MPRLADLRLILALGQHTEWFSKRQVSNNVESQVVEPVERIHMIPFSLLLSALRPSIPLLLQLFKVMMNILLKLQHTLGRKGVRYRLSLSRMFRTIPRVEQTTPDRHEGVVVLAL